MEGMSVEDEGEGVLFHVFCYNVQPGIGIDYATGESWLESTSGSDSVSGSDSGTASSGAADSGSSTEADSGSVAEEIHYVLNTSSMIFHLPECSGAKNMSTANRLDYTGTRDALLEGGYHPCGRCKP